MKISFYCPLKPISHPTPSGDREIARGLHSFLSSRAEVFVVSEFRSRLFFRSPLKILSWLIELIRAYKRVRREKPDVFFTYHLYYKAPDPINFLLAWWFRKPYFVFEGMYARQKSRRFGFWSGYILTKFALRYATRIFSDKTEDFEFLERWFPGKSVYLPPSVDVSFFSSDALKKSAARNRFGVGEAPLIVTVAMLRPDRKTEGVEFLVRALAGIKQDFLWLHVGGGACEEQVKKMSASLLGEKGRLLGQLSPLEIREVLSAADIFAFPGLDEGFGLVYVEAQAAGLPVVAFNNGGIPDAVKEEVTAFLTPVNDENAYREAMLRLLNDSALRAKMGQEAVAYASEKFDRTKNYERLWNLLH